MARGTRCILGAAECIVRLLVRVQVTHGIAVHYCEPQNAALRLLVRANVTHGIALARPRKASCQAAPLRDAARI
jgi:hypothetical protein